MQPSTSDTTSAGGPVRARPRMATVFGAAFLAGAVVAFGVNRVLEVHLTQARPQVECEPIFVALRSLPQGSPITVWDVALRDWPKAMLPSNALRAEDSFEGMVLRHPLREGQPLVTAQLAEAVPPAADRTAGAAGWPPSPAPESWTPARPAAGLADVSHAAAPAAVATAEPVSPATPPADPAPTEPTVAAAPAAPPVTANPSAAADVESAALVSSAPAAIDQAASLPAAAAPVATEPPAAAPAADLAADAGAEPAAAAVEPTTPVAPALPASIPTTASVHGIADLPPVDAAAATVTDAVVTLPSVATTAVPTLAEPWPTANPGAAPLAPPVPMSPATDIEMPLASITAPRPRPAPRSASALRSASAPRSASAARTASAPPATGPATPAPAAAPLRHLVVPERVAVQADASFVNPQPDRGRGPLPKSSGRQAAAAPRQRPRGVPQAPSPTAPASQGQRNSNAPAARKPIQGRTEAAPAKPAGWLPKLGFGFGASTSR